MGEFVFWSACLLGTVWVLYMATFRPEQWRELCKENRERNRSLMSGGFKVGQFLWRNYRR